MENGKIKKTTTPRRKAPARPKSLYSQDELKEIFRRFSIQRPEPKGELEHVNPFTLVVAVALSAQATDRGVNRATEALFAVADTPRKMLDLGVQLHGGAGFMDEYPISRMFSDARVNRILAGSSEVMRLIIGRDVFSENYKSILD